MINQHTPKATTFATHGSTSVARQSHSKKFNFVKKTLDKLPLPTNAQRSYFYDSTTRGLALAVSPAGKKVFVLYRKVDGRPERITIGPYPDLSIEQARGKAAELNGAIARGENPASKRRLVRDEATLGDLFSTYLEHHAKPHKKTWSEDQEMFDNHLTGWKHRKLSEIRRTDVLTFHARTGGKSGPYMANRLVQLLRSMFIKAIEWGWSGENPATKIKPFKEQKRERFLQREELPAFWVALANELNQTMKDFIYMCLWTGARRSNVQEMRWSEINFHAATWTIAGTSMKNGEPMTIPLSKEALSILIARMASSKSEWVFPGKGKTGHLVEPKTALKRILERAAAIQRKSWLEANPGKTQADFEREFPNAGFKNLRVHDLRRTLGSWQAITGASLPIIGKSLGHKSPAATQIYARLSNDPVRAAMDKAKDAMLLAANGTAGLLGNGNG
jgi:integrase